MGNRTFYLLEIGKLGDCLDVSMGVIDTAQVTDLLGLFLLPDFNLVNNGGCIQNVNK